MSGSKRKTTYQNNMKRNIFYNEDCIQGCREHIEDNVIDLVVTDGPFAIRGDKLDRHYGRSKELILPGYVEIPAEEYAEFCKAWVSEVARILCPGGSAYIVSGYTHLPDILNALRETSLKEVNHIIWEYNFGVYTTRKYVTSHYHILYYYKPGGKRVFNTYARFGPIYKDKKGNPSYQDRQDVWHIGREFKRGQVKNQNELPRELLKKIIQYSSNEGDIVCDLFLGSFSTAKVAIGLNRYAIGFEKNKIAYDYQMKIVKDLKPGYLLSNSGTERN